MAERTLNTIDSIFSLFSLKPNALIGDFGQVYGISKVSSSLFGFKIKVYGFFKVFPIFATWIFETLISA
jgi:hypothetical protein